MLIELVLQISTVVQFRALDWGMEACVLTLRLPSDEKAIQANSTVSLGGRLNDIDIYRLIKDKGSQSLDTVIDQRKLSYQTRPAFGEKVGTVSVDYGTEWTYKFPCAMDSLHAFALVAADDSARIEWWQDKQSLEPGEPTVPSPDVLPIVTIADRSLVEQHCTSRNMQLSKGSSDPHDYNVFCLRHGHPQLTPIVITTS